MTDFFRSVLSITVSLALAGTARAQSEPAAPPVKAPAANAAAPIAAAANAPSLPVPRRLEDSVVRVLVSKKSVDYNAPWQFEEVEQQMHLGVVVEGNRILTTAYAVADAAFIELSKFGSTRKTELRPLFVDYEVNLALLKPVTSDQLEKLRPAPIGDDLAINDKVDIYKARDAYQLMRMQASLQEVGIYAAVTSLYNLAAYLLKVQQSGLGWSEPVFDGNRLAAIASGQDANYVYAIPASIIRHFIEDSADNDYKGFPAMGVALAPLVSPDVRKLLKAEKYDHGVRVSEVSQGSAFTGVLQENDIILEVDGVQISELGFYDHPKWGKIHLRYLLNKHSAGDKLKLKILRDGKEMALEGALTRFDSNRYPVLINRYGEPEPHLIVGGFVFQELTRPYLKQWGREWEELAPMDLMYTYMFENKPEADASRRFIFVNRVLADEFNRGLNDIKLQVVDEVNGLKVTSMASLAEALKKPVTRHGKQFVRIKFVREGGEAILAMDGLAAAHKRMAQTYEITTPASFFTPPH